jgi:hypothetical protein
VESPTDAAETATATSEPSATEEPTQPPTPTQTSVPTLTPTPAVCGEAPAPPGDALDLTSVTTDLTGDGLDDELATYAVPSEDEWHLRITFGAGGSIDEVIEGSSLVAAARPIGGHDIDGDGRAEAFVTVGSGAATILIGLYVVGDCGLSRVTLDGFPAVFPVGATVGNTSGLRCEAPGLSRLFAMQTTEESYVGGSQPYALQGSVLIDGPQLTGELTMAGAAQLAVFTCGGLVLPEG